jgi:hypothetical protein
LHVPSHEHRRRARTLGENQTVKGEYKTLKQKTGNAKPVTSEDIFDSPISDCELQEAIKKLKNRKSPGEDQIHACGEGSKNLNTYVVSKNLGNRYCALTLKKNNSARTENRRRP